MPRAVGGIDQKIAAAYADYEDFIAYMEDMIERGSRRGDLSEFREEYWALDREGRIATHEAAWRNLQRAKEDAERARQPKLTLVETAKKAKARMTMLAMMSPTERAEFEAREDAELDEMLRDFERSVYGPIEVDPKVANKAAKQAAKRRRKWEAIVDSQLDEHPLPVAAPPAKKKSLSDFEDGLGDPTPEKGGVANESGQAPKKVRPAFVFDAEPAPRRRRRGPSIYSTTRPNLWGLYDDDDDDDD